MGDDAGQLVRGRRRRLGLCRDPAHPGFVDRRAIWIAFACAAGAGQLEISRSAVRRGASVREDMTDRTIDLDGHRGMAAQKATEIRRLLADVEADAQSLRLRQEALEAQLLALPAGSWLEAAGKARYLIGLFAATQAAQDPRRQKLIANVLDDFARLSRTGAP
jgi:hypothetical protein